MFLVTNGTHYVVIVDRKIVTLTKHKEFARRFTTQNVDAAIVLANHNHQMGYYAVPAVSQ